MPDEPIEQEEKYEPTASDLALFASLRITEVAGAILQAHVDGLMNLETYKKLYEVARRRPATAILASCQIGRRTKRR